MKKYIPSRIQTKCECYICHRDSSQGLDHHHCLHGTGDRKKADEDGLWVWLCRTCHRRLHDYGEHDKELQAAAQRAYIEWQKKLGYPEEAAKEIYFERYKKFYE